MQPHLFALRDMIPSAMGHTADPMMQPIYASKSVTQSVNRMFMITSLPPPPLLPFTFLAWN